MAGVYVQFPIDDDSEIRDDDCVVVGTQNNPMKINEVKNDIFIGKMRVYKFLPMSESYYTDQIDIASRYYAMEVKKIVDEKLAAEEKAKNLNDIHQNQFLYSPFLSANEYMERRQFHKLGFELEMKEIQKIYNLQMAALEPVKLTTGISEQFDPIVEFPPPDVVNATHRHSNEINNNIDEDAGYSDDEQGQAEDDAFYINELGHNLRRLHDGEGPEGGPPVKRRRRRAP